MYTLGKIAKQRAMQQTKATIETKIGTVIRTYTQSGYVTSCDIQLKNQQKILVQVQNAAGNNWARGDSVLVNLQFSSSNRPSIIGPASSGTANNIVQNGIALVNGANVAASTASTTGLNGTDFILGAPSTQVSGSVIEPGSNVYFTYSPAQIQSGGVTENTLTVNAKRMVLTTLPNPSTTVLPDGTLVDLIDSYRNVLGMYRLDLTLGVWEREDIGEGKVYVDANDTSQGFLGAKLAAGSNITLTTLNSGGNEQLQISATGGGTLAGDVVGLSGSNLVEGFWGVSLDASQLGSSFARLGYIYDNATGKYITEFNLWMPNCRTVATSNVSSLSGLTTVANGITCDVATKGILLTAQTTGSENGPWQVQSGAWTRPAGYATGSIPHEGISILITEGTYAGTYWYGVGTANPHSSYTVGTSPTTWTETGSATNAITALTGDGTASGPGSVALTLATVNSNVGTFGDATHSAGVTVNGKGLITAVTSNAISGAGVPFPAYAGGTSYTANQVALGSDNNLYIAQTSTTGNSPVGDTGTNWKLWALQANLTLNCGVAQTFPDTFASSGSPGGAMTPGMISALAFLANAVGAVSPTVATVTLQQCNNPTFTASANGSTTTIKTTTNIPIGASLLLNSVGGGGTITVGTTTSVTASSYSSGTYTLTVGSLGASSVSGDVFCYAPVYNTITVSQLTIGQNVIIQGSVAGSPGVGTPIVWTGVPPSITTANTGGHIANGTYYCCVSYTYTDASGTTRETMPGAMTSIIASSASSIATITCASFTMPSWATGAYLYATTSTGISAVLNRQATFTITGQSGGFGGTASALTWTTAYSTATPSKTSNNPAATYPCAIIFPSNTNGITINSSLLQITGLYVYNPAVSLGSGIGAGVVNSVTITAVVVSGFEFGIRATQNTSILSCQVDSSTYCIYGGSPGLVTASNTVCLRPVSGNGMTAYIFSYFTAPQSSTLFCTNGYFAEYGGSIRMTATNPASGTAQPTFGCSNTAVPAFNSFGSGVSASSIIYNN